MAVEKNNEVKKAEEEYEYLTGEEAEQRLAFLREKGERDYNSGMQYAMRNGIEQGIEKGIEKEKREIAKRLKEKGIDVDIIIEATRFD